MEAARSMLYAKKFFVIQTFKKNFSFHHLHLVTQVPLVLWTNAVNHANYNRVPSKGSTITPLDAISRIKPDISLHIFCSKAYIHVPSELRQKLDSNCKIGLFVGICENTKAFRIWDSTDGKTKICRDVFIYEKAQLEGLISQVTQIFMNFK